MVTILLLHWAMWIDMEMKISRCFGCIVLRRKVCRETQVPSMSRPIYKLLGNVTRRGELWEYSNQAGREVVEGSRGRRRWIIRCDYPHG